MTISKNIKSIREQYNLSQKELALIAGVSEQAVSTWETGIREPRMGAIQKIADHFGLKKSDIIDGKELNEKLLFDVNVTRAFAKLLASKDKDIKEAKIEIINDVVRMNASVEQLKALSAFLKTLK